MQGRHSPEAKDADNGSRQQETWGRARWSRGNSKNDFQIERRADERLRPVKLEGARRENLNMGRWLAAYLVARRLGFELRRVASMSDAKEFQVLLHLSGCCYGTE